MSAADELLTIADLAVSPGAMPDSADLPQVGVVIANYNGREQLLGCLASLAAQDYPKAKLRIAVFDNGSKDGSAKAVRAEYPDVVLLENERNLGFTPAANGGAKALPESEHFAFLNNDARVEPMWLRELVAPIVRGECAATSSLMLDESGSTVDFAGGGCNFHGVAVSHGYKRPRGPEHETARRTLFACGGAMAVDANVFNAIGGFDDEFFAYYDDLDIGWRLWIAGHEVHTAPRALCRHAHSHTSGRFPYEQVRLLQVRNAILTCFKNYDRPNLDRLLPAILALAVRRTYFLVRDKDDRALRIERAKPYWQHRLRKFLAKLLPGSFPSFRMGDMASADLLALNDVVGNWDHWEKRRAVVQATRKRDDSEILRLFEKPLWCIEPRDPGYVALHESMLKSFAIDELFRGCTLEGPAPLD